MKRALTAVLLAPPICYLLYQGPDWGFTAVVVAVGLLCFHEFVGLARGHGWDIGGPFGYVAGLVVLLAATREILMFVLVAVIAMTLALRAGEMSEILPRASALLLGVAYVFGALRCGLELRSISPHWLAFAMVLNWIGDTAAYYAGRAFGRRKLAPLLSPAKTWEGAAASLVASMAFGVLYLGRFVPATPWVEALGLSAAANLAGQAGDLAESAMKRGAGVKDSGNLLPGHGGWLDRVDSSLFAFPVVLAWLVRMGSL
ncbi:MAG: phosphatidate cytidylyltransferase [Bryobacteraceae bacterium]